MSALGPAKAFCKEQLPRADVAVFTASVLHAEAHLALREGYYDVAPYYWLSAGGGSPAAELDSAAAQYAQFMAKVKNLTLATGDAPEPFERVMGEGTGCCSSRPGADRHHRDRGRDLIALYAADPTSRSRSYCPVSISRRSPRPRSVARRRYGFDDDDAILLFVVASSPEGPRRLACSGAMQARRPEFAPG